LDRGQQFARVCDTEKDETRYEKEPPPNITSEFGRARDLFSAADMEASMRCRDGGWPASTRLKTGSTDYLGNHGPVSAKQSAPYRTDIAAESRFRKLSVAASALPAIIPD